jgi:hypothetical protein
MLKGLSLSELAQRIEGLKTQKKDFIADTASVEMRPSETGTSLVIPSQQPLAIRPTAHNQIANRLGIPVKYYDRMLADQPELLAQNVNTWFHANPEKRMVRVLKDNVRAFLSNQYQRIENEEIAEVALPVLLDIPQVQIVSCEVTERRMYIQAVSPRVQGEVKVGDVVQAGVVISNSEIGFGAVSVTPMVYRLRCLNGMILPDQRFSARHVGRKIEDNEALWADDTKKADDRAILLKVRDMVRNAVGEIEFGKVVAKMQGMTEAKIVGNPAAAVEVLAQKIGANETETGGILRSLIEGGDLSKWGVLNAVTAQAHDATDYDRAVDFEKLGGQLLELPQAEWKQVLEADAAPVRRRRRAAAQPVIDVEAVPVAA